MLRVLRSLIHSSAYIARQGGVPSGNFKICKGVIDVPEQQWPDYLRLIQQETPLFELPARPQICLNFLEVSDYGYREFQFTMRVRMQGEERWYLQFILINNFYGWLWGLKDYGYNKFLYQVNFIFDRQMMALEVPRHRPAISGYFTPRDDLSVTPPEDDGSWSVKGRKVIFCKAGVSQMETQLEQCGYLNLSLFREAEGKPFPFPLDWQAFIPPDPIPARLFHGKAQDVAMGERLIAARF